MRSVSVYFCPDGGTKKLVPKMADTNVAGKKSTVTNAMTFIDAESRVDTFARSTETLASRWAMLLKTSI